MKLEDLKPRPSKFFMEKLSDYVTLRAWTMEDQIWLQQEYGDKVQKIFDPESVDIGAICRIAYRLITDRSPFKASEKKTFDEDGNPVIEKIGGWRRMALMLSGPKEQVDLFTSVIECIGVSMPEVDDVKKKVNEAMNQENLPIGEKSSTSLVTNTDGLRSTSLAEHSKKSNGDYTQSTDA